MCNKDTKMDIKNSCRRIKQTKKESLSISEMSFLWPLGITE